MHAYRIRNFVVVCLAMAACARIAAGGITIFSMDLDGFVDAAGSLEVIDFDGIPSGTNISNTTIQSVTFMPNDAPLIVVAADDTFTPDGFTNTPNPETNTFPATTEPNVLSPGGAELGPGSDPVIENDDLTIVFDQPVSAFGFDHLSQSADGFSFTSIHVLDTNGATLFLDMVPISNLGGGGAPAGADFWGIVSDTANIKQIWIDEGDENNEFPDCNIGFDTIRFTPIVTACPADLDTDGMVGVADLLQMLGAWGPCDACVEDLDENGEVGVTDLLALLAGWGSCSG